MAINYISGKISDVHREAVKIALRSWPIYKRSHRKEMANLVGCTGEVIVERWLKKRGLNPIIVGSIDHDMEIVGSNGKIINFDIKTKDRTVKPMPKYEATVPAYVYDKQKPDFYIFVSLYRPSNSAKNNFTEGYIVGAISRDDFDKKKYFEESGRKSNGAMFFTDAWNVKIEDLDEPMSFPY